MIDRLYLRSFAIADEVTIGFGPGFNVITGETGAGKSIILNAIAMIMGDRAENTLIRAGEEEAVVESSFSGIGEADLQFVREKGLPCDDEIIIKRLIRRNGKNTVYINGSQTTLAILREIMERLVDLNNQNDHQRLMHPEEHYKFLDAFGGYQPVVTAYQEAFRDYAEHCSRYDRFKTNEKEIRRKLDALRYEYDEITAAAPAPGEDDTLGDELKMLEHAHDLINAAQDINALLNDDDTFTVLTDRLLANAKALKGFNEQLNSGADAVSASIDGLYEAAREIERQVDALDLDEERLAWVNERLSILEKLKRKYGDTLDDVIAYCEKIGREIADIEEMTFDSKAIELKIAELREGLQAKAMELTSERKAAAEHFKKAIEDELAYLGMEKADFSVRFLPWDTGVKLDDGFVALSGPENIEFFIATNLGEGYYPFAAIASGGELSRVLFAIKAVTGKRFSLGSLIFDEIDTGIGGDTSRKLGLKMKEMAQGVQLVVITHQPQIASLADGHYYVEKLEQSGRTISRVSELSPVQHIEEIARMIGGNRITDFTLKTAEEMCQIGKDHL